MALDFAVLEPGLAAWVADLSGVPANAVTWENAPRAWSNGARALLSWVSTVGRGGDELRIEDNGAAIPDPDVEHVAVGRRVLGLQIGFETERQSPGAPHGRAYAEAMRARLELPESTDALEALNLGLIGAADDTDADYPADGRMVHRAVLGLRFNATSVVRGRAIPSIETVGLVPRYETAPGGEVAASLEIAGDLS